MDRDSRDLHMLVYVLSRTFSILVVELHFKVEFGLTEDA